jgi:hypothetical protein
VGARCIVSPQSVHEGCGSRIFGPRCHTTTYALHASQPDPLRCRLTEAKLRQLDEFDTADPRLPPRVHPPPNGLGRRKLGTASATRGPSTLGDQSFPDEETGSSLIVHLARYGTPHQATSGVPPEQQAAVHSFCLCPQHAGDTLRAPAWSPCSSTACRCQETASTSVPSPAGSRVAGAGVADAGL